MRSTATRHRALVVALALVVVAAGCGGDDDPDGASRSPVDGGATAATDPAGTASPGTDPSSPGDTAGTRDTAPRPPAVLTVDGFAGHRFGIAPMDQAVAAAADLLGPPTDDDVNEACGAGPVRIAQWDGLHLLGQGGTVDGWYYSGTEPPLATPEGITSGTLTVELTGEHPGGELTDGSLGPEFHAPVPSEHPDSYLGAFLSDPGTEGAVDQLYAGLTCFFR